MNPEKLLQVLIAPVISEKSTRAADSRRQFVFKVLGTATKPEIKAAVEKAFEVEVENVQVVSMPGKVKRHGKTLGRRRDWKKAYVRLKEGFDIDFASGQQ